MAQAYIDRIRNLHKELKTQVTLKSYLKEKTRVRDLLEVVWKKFEAILTDALPALATDAEKMKVLKLA